MSARGRGGLPSVVVLLLVAAPARGNPPLSLDAPPEPTLVELQRAAIAAARVDPERIASLERRMRAAALLPQLRVRVGRGTGQILTTSEYDGTARLSVGDRDAWQIDLSAAWSLDRLAYHSDELRLVREFERVAVHRERLLRQVAELYTERRRLREAMARARAAPAAAAPTGPISTSGPAPLALPAPPPPGSDDLSLRYAALTATLDALTGGALLRER